MSVYIIAALALLASVGTASAQKPPWYGMDHDEAVRQGLHPPPRQRIDMSRAEAAAADPQRTAQRAAQQRAEQRR
jgi:hypothetical protein